MRRMLRCLQADDGPPNPATRPAPNPFDLPISPKPDPTIGCSMSSSSGMDGGHCNDSSARSATAITQLTSPSALHLPASPLMRTHANTPHLSSPGPATTAATAAAGDVSEGLHGEGQGERASRRTSSSSFELVGSHEADPASPTTSMSVISLRDALMMAEQLEHLGGDAKGVVAASVAATVAADAARAERQLAEHMLAASTAAQPSPGSSYPASRSSTDGSAAADAILQGTLAEPLTPTNIGLRLAVPHSVSSAKTTPAPGVAALDTAGSSLVAVTQLNAIAANPGQAEEEVRGVGAVPTALPRPRSSPALGAWLMRGMASMMMMPAAGRGLSQGPADAARQDAAKAMTAARAATGTDSASVGIRADSEGEHEEDAGLDSQAEHSQEEEEEDEDDVVDVEALRQELDELACKLLEADAELAAERAKRRSAAADAAAQRALVLQLLAAQEVEAPQQQVPTPTSTCAAPTALAAVQRGDDCSSGNAWAAVVLQALAATWALAMQLSAAAARCAHAVRHGAAATGKGLGHTASRTGRQWHWRTQQRGFRLRRQVTAWRAWRARSERLVLLRLAAVALLSLLFVFLVWDSASIIGQTASTASMDANDSAPSFTSNQTASWLMTDGPVAQQQLNTRSSIHRAASSGNSPAAVTGRSSGNDNGDQVADGGIRCDTCPSFPQLFPIALGPAPAAVALAPGMHQAQLAVHHAGRACGCARHALARKRGPKTQPEAQAGHTTMPQLYAAALPAIALPAPVQKARIPNPGSFAIHPTTPQPGLSGLATRHGPIAPAPPVLPSLRRNHPTAKPLQPASLGSHTRISQHEHDVSLPALTSAAEPAAAAALVPPTSAACAAGTAATPQQQQEQVAPGTRCHSSGSSSTDTHRCHADLGQVGHFPGWATAPLALPPRYAGLTYNDYIDLTRSHSRMRALLSHLPKPAAQRSTVSTHSMRPLAVSLPAAAPEHLSARAQPPALPDPTSVPKLQQLHVVHSAALQMQLHPAVDQPAVSQPAAAPLPLPAVHLQQGLLQLLDLQPAQDAPAMARSSGRGLPASKGPLVLHQRTRGLLAGWVKATQRATPNTTATNIMRHMSFALVAKAAKTMACVRSRVGEGAGAWGTAFGPFRALTCFDIHTRKTPSLQHGNTSVRAATKDKTQGCGHWLAVRTSLSTAVQRWLPANKGQAALAAMNSKICNSSNQVVTSRAGLLAAEPAVAGLPAGAPSHLVLPTGAAMPPGLPPAASSDTGSGKHLGRQPVATASTAIPLPPATSEPQPALPDNQLVGVDGVQLPQTQRQGVCTVQITAQQPEAAGSATNGASSDEVCAVPTSSQQQQQQQQQQGAGSGQGAAASTASHTAREQQPSQRSSSARNHTAQQQQKQQGTSRQAALTLRQLQAQLRERVQRLQATAKRVTQPLSHCLEALPVAPPASKGSPFQGMQQATREVEHACGKRVHVAMQQVVPGQECTMKTAQKLSKVLSSVDMRGICKLTKSKQAQLSCKASGVSAAEAAAAWEAADEQLACVLLHWQDAVVSNGSSHSDRNRHKHVHHQHTRSHNKGAKAAAKQLSHVLRPAARCLGRSGTAAEMAVRAARHCDGALGKLHTAMDSVQQQLIDGMDQLVNDVSVHTGMIEEWGADQQLTEMLGWARRWAKLAAKDCTAALGLAGLKSKPVLVAMRNHAHDLQHTVNGIMSEANALHRFSRKHAAQVQQARRHVP